MGVIGDLVKGIGKFVGSEKDAKTASENRKRAEKDYWARMEASNFEPEYASQHAPKFQKSQSPVARAYLESFLTGANPDAINGTQLGASGPANVAGTKAAAQSDFDKRYGGWDAIQKKQNEVAADNSRFEVTPITRPVEEKAGEDQVRYPWKAEWEKKLGRALEPKEFETLKRWQAGSGKSSIPKIFALKGIYGGTPEQITAALAGDAETATQALYSGKR